MFKWFQNLASPFPDALIETPSKNFWAFAWACTQGLRPYLLGMTICTGIIAAFEAALFAMMGKVVDWLSTVPKEALWQNYTSDLVILAAILLLSTLFILLQTMFKHQTLAANFPMPMRWNFHRLMLNQSMSFGLSQSNLAPVTGKALRIFLNIPSLRVSCISSMVFWYPVSNALI
jgi:ATP-binding cassette subfamily B multidrug efflux pump